MPYNIRPVTTPPGVGTNHFDAAYVQGTGFPATFPYAVFSAWVELSTNGAGWQGNAFGRNIVFSIVGDQDSIRGMTVAMSPVDPLAAPGIVNIVLGNGVSYPIGGGDFENFGVLAFDTPVLVANHYYNLLISVDSFNNIIQCYLDDAPLTLTGGSVWHALSNISEPFGTNFTSPGVIFDGTYSLAGAPNSVSPPPCMADFFLGVPVAFFDLSIEANRRKFINADLSPVDLGDDASSVFGSAPQIYCTVRPTDGGAPAFQLNRGITGGFFTGSPGSAIFCEAPPPPTPGATVLNMGHVIATSLATESPCTALQFTPSLPVDFGPAIGLRWSDTRGATWGNPVPQPLSTDPLAQPVWNRTGYARDRVFELFWSFAFKTALNGAFVDVEPFGS